MNDETNKEVVVLMFRATKLTAEAVAEAMARYRQNSKEEKRAKKLNKPVKEKHGKMTLKELMAQNAGAVGIEIPRDGVGEFVKIAKSHRVDFTIKKDATTKPPTYMCFFKGRDKDVIEAAFKQFIKKQEQKNERPSFSEELKKSRAEAKKRKEQNRAKRKERAKEREVFR